MSSEQSQGWSQETERVLRRAGWQPGRSVRTDTWEHILRERGGFVAHEAARRFLAEFGGLVTYGWPADAITTQSAVRFDPLTAEWEDATFVRLSEEAGTVLFPVGRADNGASHLGMAESGALYLARGRVELLGATTEQALDALVSLQATMSSLWIDAARVPHAFWGRLETTTAANASGRWSAETERVLRAAGWYPGRAVPVDTWESVLHLHGEFGIHEAARAFLAEFGYVGIPYREPFSLMPSHEFRLDPLMALWDAEILDDLGERAGTGLYPVGMRDRCNEYLAMAESGAVYAGMDSVRLLAATPDEALEKLIRRIRRSSQPR
ncbi:SUKH-3 domain-containing protein [Streptomyces sp. NPDC006610]|uniref:SUKH-3 domain-containing protein n=1 Tax=Streptomyces sp. NPDC006610 TaxID=3154584 RepID=UPI00339E6E0A